MPTYTVSTWDPDDNPDGDWGWTVAFEHLPKWGLRDVIRELRGRGYSHFSYLVERED